MAVKELNAKLLEEIKQHLPGMVAEELKEFIEQAKKDKERITSLENDCAYKTNRISELLKSNEELMSIKTEFEKEKTLIKSYKDWYEKAKHEYDILVVRKEETEKREGLLKDMFSGVFKNTVFKEQTIKDMVTPLTSYRSVWDGSSETSIPTGQYTQREPVTESKEIKSE